jgi:hypothetical protein
MTNDVAVRSSVSVSLQITNLVELRDFCKVLASTEMVPKAYKGKPDDILVAMLHGQEVGLPHLQALQSIATVNGIPSVYGDAGLAMVRASGKLEDFDEWIEVDGQRQAGSSFPIMKWSEEGKMIVAHCLALRTGAKRPRITTYSVDDAKRAGLWGKVGPWTMVPQRMLMFRARGWNLRDEFGDVLKGLAIYEEARDIETEQEPDGTYRPAVVIVEPEQGEKTVETELNGSAKKAASVLDKMKPTTAPARTASSAAAPTAPPAPPETHAAGPVTGGEGSGDGYPADWLSTVLDAEDFLRGTQAGHGILRSIRAGFKLNGDAYPMLPEHQTEYLNTLRLSVERMQKPKA